ncbi:hypothetical protein JHK82_020907 [Glycine max]|nr:hypothetical protein JHK82_020907 [Glycine max]
MRIEGGTQGFHGEIMLCIVHVVLVLMKKMEKVYKKSLILLDQPSELYLHQKHIMSIVKNVCNLFTKKKVPLKKQSNDDLPISTRHHECVDTVEEHDHN